MKWERTAFGFHIDVSDSYVLKPGKKRGWWWVWFRGTKLQVYGGLARAKEAAERHASTRCQSPTHTGRGYKVLARCWKEAVLGDRCSGCCTASSAYSALEGLCAFISFGLGRQAVDDGTGVLDDKGTPWETR